MLSAQTTRTLCGEKKRRRSTAPKRSSARRKETAVLLHIIGKSRRADHWSTSFRLHASRGREKWVEPLDGGEGRNKNERRWRPHVVRKIPENNEIMRSVRLPYLPIYLRRIVPHPFVASYTVLISPEPPLYDAPPPPALARASISSVMSGAAASKSCNQGNSDLPNVFPGRNGKTQPIILRLSHTHQVGACFGWIGGR